MTEIYYSINFEGNLFWYKTDQGQCFTEQKAGFAVLDQVYL